MNILKCLATLMLAFLAVALAANEKEILIRVRPITRSQYESILKINDGKPVIPEGRLINSAITGIAGLAAGFQLSKYLPNLFGANNQSSKGSSVLGGYPLCTINTNAVTGRQNDANSYLNIDELTNSLVQQNGDKNDLPTMNCILVLDDGKDKPSGEKPEQTTTTSTTAMPTTMEPPTFRPVPTYAPTYPPPHHPTYPTAHHPSYPPPHRPPHYPTYPPAHHPSYPPPQRPPFHPPSSHLPYLPFYPGYPSYYPYPPPFYPMPHPPYIKYPIYDKEDDYEPEPEPEQNDEDDEQSALDSAVKLQTFLMNKLQVINGLSTTTTTTTRKPTKKPSRRPASRPHPRPPNHPPHYQTHAKSQRLHFNENLDDYDDSIDYIEVSKKFHH
ncbi:circumsporozoite protein-like [Calliphora vicina]|uniref:circumsporozoite protein-like n=1 Tax=Calliphora vicina TaxID=7373 RepID=UPI00325BD17C